MLQLDAFTWIRFSIWMAIGIYIYILIIFEKSKNIIVYYILYIISIFCTGLTIYFFYGISHSEQGKKNKIEAEMIKRKYADQVRIVTRF